MNRRGWIAWAVIDGLIAITFTAAAIMSPHWSYPLAASVWSVCTGICVANAMWCK